MPNCYLSRLALVLALVVCPTVSHGQARLDEDAPQPATRVQRPLSPLAANADQVAAAIGIEPMVERVRQLAAERNSLAAMTREELVLRQQITDGVVAASLDVDGVLAQIDYERVQILEVRDSLASSRDRKLKLLSLANIAGTGLGVIGTGMQFSDSTAIAGDAVGVAGGTASGVLSFLSLRQQGGKQQLGIAPNMLAPLFGRQPELRSVYPPDVWSYLSTTPANYPRQHIPWTEELLQEWVQTGRIGPPDAPQSQKKIDLLTSRIGEHRRLSIDVLSDRLAMLNDLGARVSVMKQDLRDLINAVRNTY